MLKALRLVTLIVALRNENKDYHVSLTKSAGLIKKLIDKNLNLLLNDQSVTQI